jgi:AcrR family transcriptional regulator
MESRVPPARGKKRRAEILKAALTLFNGRGTAAVSTNHISAELGISVGNLYWHFRDKDAIVRALYEEQVRKHDELWTSPKTEHEAIDVAIRGLRRSFAIAWDYRFLYRELASLIRADSELRKMYASARELRRRELRAFLRSFVELGVLRAPENEALAAQLEDLAWMTTSFWLPHLELRDGVLTKRTAMEGARAVMALFLPYATKEHFGALSLALERPEDERRSPSGGMALRN